MLTTVNVTTAAAAAAAGDGDVIDECRVWIFHAASARIAGGFAEW